MNSVTDGYEALRLGALEEAEAIFSRLLRENPLDVESLRGLALICLDRKNSGFAIELLLAALRVRPDFLAGRCDLARIFIARAQHTEALRILDFDGVPLADRSELLLLRGNALRALGRLEEALTCYKNGYSAEHHVEFSINYANVLIDLKRFEEAERVVSSVVDSNPDNDHALFNLSLLSLRLGRWQIGWPLQEKRPRRSVDKGWRVGALIQSLEESSSRGLTPQVLLHAEQGLGDVIQYLRFVNHPCFARAAITVQVPKALADLTKLNFKNISIEIDTAVLQKDFDFKLSLLSLPSALGLQTESELASKPYLAAPPSRALEILETVRGKGSQCCMGIQWRGGNNPRLINRSMPIEFLHPLTSRADRLVSLRQSPTAEEMQWLDENRVIQLDSLMSSLADTAAVIENLDIVVTVDTSIAHLAGAMGKQTFVLLPYSAAWTWMEGRSDTPWYPSVTLIRQTAPGDWASCISILEETL